MVDREAEKRLAAKRAVEWVESGMRVGLGTGSTAAYVVQELGKRIAEGLRIEAIVTSTATEELARSLGIPLTSFESRTTLDVAIDGADEIDPQLQAIKGGGGALLREKIVAAASRHMIVIVDASKPVATLGRFKLPLEVLPFAAPFVREKVAELGAVVTQRKRGEMLFVTDQGNLILDAAFGTIADAPSLAAQLDAIPGILEHGLFLDEIDTLVIGRGEQVEVKNRTAV